MILYHGTDKNFDEFDHDKILSGEGLEKRGYGFNFSADKEVAKHFFFSSGKDKGYILEVSVPNEEYFLNLEDSCTTCCSIPLYELAVSLANHQNFDVEEIFDEAANNDDLSMSYPDDRAREFFKLAVTNNNNDEAWDELHEWSPGYDWNTFSKKLEDTIDFQFDNDTTGLSLYNHIASVLESSSEASKFFHSEGIVGTYSCEAFSKEGKDKSYVVFDTNDIQIKKKENIEFKPKQRRKIKP